jgi:hypothetical protein
VLKVRHHPAPDDDIRPCLRELDGHRPPHGGAPPLMIAALPGKARLGTLNGMVICLPPCAPFGAIAVQNYTLERQWAHG